MDTSLETVGTIRAGLAPAAVVVPLDGSAAATAALPVARWLGGALGAPVQRVTVETGPGDPLGLVDADGEVEYLLHGEGVGAALIDHLAAQTGGLVCMATRARGGLLRHLGGNLVDHLVASGAAPMVVVGPECVDEHLATPPATILLAVSDHLPGGTARMCARWAMALDAAVVVATVLAPALAGDVPTGGIDADARWSRVRGGFLGGIASFPAGENDALLGPIVRELADVGIASTASILTGGTVATSLLAYAETLPGPVLLVAPVGDRDGRIPGDVTHQLLQRSRWPVVASLGAAD